MKLVKVKEIVELLLIKKRNSTTTKEDEILLDELSYLLMLAKQINTTQIKTECECEIDLETIENEIEQNKCFSCGLAIVNYEF